MKRSETAMVLAKLAAVDNRRMDDSHGTSTPILDAWHEVIGDLSAADCLAAARIHRQRSTEWAQPGHIRAIALEIRKDRMKTVDDSTVTPNVDPDIPEAYNAEIAAIRAAIASGRFDADAYAASGRSLSGHRAMKAIGDGSKPADLVGVSLAPARVDRVLRRPERPLPVDYGTAPVKYTPEVPPERVAALEAERARQLAALEVMMGSGQEQEGA